MLHTTKRRKLLSTYFIREINFITFFTGNSLNIVIVIFTYAMQQWINSPTNI